MRLNMRLDTYLKRNKKSLTCLLSEHGISSYSRLVSFLKTVCVTCPLESELPRGIFKKEKLEEAKQIDLKTSQEVNKSVSKAKKTQAQRRKTSTRSAHVKRNTKKKSAIKNQRKSSKSEE